MTKVGIQTPKEVSEGAKLAEKLFNKIPKLVFDYGSSISHTQSMLNKSMVIAYSKGLNDAITFLLKEEQDKKTDEKNEIA